MKWLHICFITINKARWQIFNGFAKSDTIEEVAFNWSDALGDNEREYVLFLSAFWFFCRCEALGLQRSILMQQFHHFETFKEQVTTLVNALKIELPNEKVIFVEILQFSTFKYYVLVLAQFLVKRKRFSLLHLLVFEIAKAEKERGKRPSVASMVVVFNKVITVPRIEI